MCKYQLMNCNKNKYCKNILCITINFGCPVNVRVYATISKNYLPKVCGGILALISKRSAISNEQVKINW